ncbi:MAG TPA: trehalose-phosphatase, partial [Arachnia sp.]|nr:trehalose-phosphatase [Arachnia sp.]
MTSFSAQTQFAGQFLEAAAVRPGKVLLATDFDGTLALIVPNPDDSRLLPATADAFAQLGPALGGIAIITGRGVATVRRLGRLEGRPGLERLVVLGQYGAERWDAATGEETPHEVPSSIAAARPEIEELLADARFVGVRLEDKGRALGVHTRPAPDAAAAYEALREPLGSIAARHGLVLEPG